MLRSWQVLPRPCVVLVHGMFVRVLEGVLVRIFWFEKFCNFHRKMLYFYETLCDFLEMFVRLFFSTFDKGGKLEAMNISITLVIKIIIFM